MKRDVLKLNKSFFPVGISNWKTAMVDLISGSAHPIDVCYGFDENGNVDKHKIEYMEVVKEFSDWKNLPVRDFDDSVKTPKEIYRLPDIIVCSSFNKIIHKKVLFPTKNNIWNRDNWTCGYTGKKLDRENVTVDHILPSSRGGENTWENLITCDKTLNIWKGDRTPKECGLKLLWKPSKPKNGMIFSFMRDEWRMFLEGGDFSNS